MSVALVLGVSALSIVTLITTVMGVQMTYVTIKEQLECGFDGSGIMLTMIGLLIIHVALFFMNMTYTLATTGVIS